MDSFEYDTAKAEANFKKHGVAFPDGEGVLQDPLALTLEDPESRGEQRFVAIGVGHGGELLVVAYTERAGAFRLISVRRATRKERKQYES